MACVTTLPSKTFSQVIVLFAAASELAHEILQPVTAVTPQAGVQPTGQTVSLVARFSYTFGLQVHACVTTSCPLGQLLLSPLSSLSLTFPSRLPSLFGS